MPSAKARLPYPKVTMPSAKARLPYPEGNDAFREGTFDFHEGNDAFLGRTDAELGGCNSFPKSEITSRERRHAIKSMSMSGFWTPTRTHRETA